MTINQRRLAVSFAAMLAGIALLGSSCKLANKAPSVPILSGPTTGVAGVAISFTATAADPESDSLQFQFDWGDGATPAWTNLVASGDAITATNTYADSGTFTIRAKARDKSGKESDWSAGQTLSLIAAGPTHPDTVVAQVWMPWPLSGAAISPDGSLICLGPDESPDTLLLFDASSRTIRSRVPVSNYISGIAISSDNRYAFLNCHGNDRIIRLDLVQGGQVAAEHSCRGRPALVTPGDSLLLVSDGSHMLYKFSALDLTPRDSVELPGDISFYGIAVSANGLLAYVTTNQGLGKVSVEACSLLSFASTQGDLRAAVFSPDEQLLYATGTADSGVTVFETSDLSVVSRWKRPDFRAIEDLGITRDGTCLYVDMPVGLYLLDTRTMMPTDSIAVDDMWGDVLVHPGGDSVYYVGYRTLYVIGRRH